MLMPLSRRDLFHSAAAGATLLAMPGLLVGCAKPGPVQAMGSTEQDEVISLIEAWAAAFGYYDGRIDLADGDDLSAFTTADCTLTAHAPLWGTKAGEEKAIPVAEVREQLAGMLKWARIARHDMHLARHPLGNAVCLFFVVKARAGVVPINLMTVPLAFVVNIAETEDGLRIEDIHERPAETLEDARTVLVDECGWPAETSFQPTLAFGAAS